jgi:hypothetical protein
MSISTVIDQQDDRNGQETYKLHTMYGFPNFVKEASAADICGGATLMPHQYADQTMRMYPCHTGPATIVSSAFFFEKKAYMNKHRATNIENNILQSADFFGVRQTVDELQKKIGAARQYDEVNLPDDAFAIVQDDGSGNKTRKYPLRNALEVKAAADWLIKYRDELPFRYRNQIADKILKKAAEYGAGLDSCREPLEKMAGRGVCAAKHAADLIRARINALGHTHQPNKLQQELLKLADMCDDTPQSIRHYHVLTKIAEAVDQFDRIHGLYRNYDDVIQRPDDVLFAVTEKAAAELDNEIVGNMLTGNFYKKADLARVPLRDLGDALGDDFVSEVSTANAWVDTEKLAAIVPTLPRDDAELFDEVLSAAGIMPFAQKSASVGTAMSRAEELNAASAHKPHPGSLWSAMT